MLRVEPFRPSHLMQISAREEQAIELDLGGQSLSEIANYYQVAGQAFTISEQRGVEGKTWREPIFCGGVIERAEHSASLWGVFGKEAQRHGLYVFHRVRNFIAMREELRLDAWVNCENNRARRLILLLGFELEGQLSNFFAPGKPALIYRRAA